MATIKGDWNIISQVYSKLFSTLMLESKDRDYWTADAENDTAIIPPGWDSENPGEPADDGKVWTKSVRTGLLNYVQTFFLKKIFWKLTKTFFHKIKPI